VGITRDLTRVEGTGFEAEADWEDLRTPETYLGYARSEGLASPSREYDVRRAYRLPERLNVNQWALAGDWTIGQESTVLESAGGSIAYRFRARDAHLVMSPGSRERIPFRVLLDGSAPGKAHGLDVDEEGRGVLDAAGLHQLIRQVGEVRERTLEITFSEPGVEAYSFTFG
jgi:hypothetical protein